MRVHVARWSDPSRPGDGARLLITRYRPRGVRKGAEPWDRWDKRLAPSEALLDAFLGKRRVGRKVVGEAKPIPWATFAARYREEMAGPEAAEALAEARRLARADGVTLLCYCEDETRCHRALARELVLGR